MTVIAYRDGVLAADTQATAGDSHRGNWTTKIAKRGRALAAVSGSAAAAHRFLDWFRTGMLGEPPNMGDKDNAGSGFIYAPGRPILRLTIHGWERYTAEYDAHGCGADYALGAMAVGATAEEAVRATLKHECMAGGEITVLRHDDEPRGHSAAEAMDEIWLQLVKNYPDLIGFLPQPPPAPPESFLNEASRKGWP